MPTGRSSQWAYGAKMTPYTVIFTSCVRWELPACPDISDLDTLNDLHLRGNANFKKNLCLFNKSFVVSLCVPQISILKYLFSSSNAAFLTWSSHTPLCARKGRSTGTQEGVASIVLTQQTQDVETSVERMSH